MTFTLDLLPPDPKLQFIEEGHQYVYHDPAIGTIKPKSVSTVLAETEAKCFNYGIWRKSLMRKGLTYHQAEAFMRWHREHRAQVGTDFHSLAEARFKSGFLFDLDKYASNVLPEAVAIFEHFNRDFVPNVAKVFIVEMPMIHKSLIYTGTPDLLVEMKDGSTLLLDYKTVPNAEKAHDDMLWWLEHQGLMDALKIARENPPNIDGKNARSWRKRDEWVLQISAYIELVRANHGITVKQGGNLVLNDTKFRLLPHNRADIAQAWNRYAGFLLEYHSRRAGLGDALSQLALPAVEALFA